MNDLKIRAFVMCSGERYSLLVDRLSGVPVYAPNLYLTTQVRNASLSHAALSVYASHLLVLHRFCLTLRIDLKSRLMTRQFLVDAELESLHDFCSYRFSVSDPCHTYRQTTASFSVASLASSCHGNNAS